MLPPPPELPVQELCDGDLTQVFSQGLLHNKQTKVPHILGILQLLRDLASGLEHIHSAGVIHGDINPRNILMKLQPSALPLGGVAQIADFGLALRLPPGSSHIPGVKHGTVRQAGDLLMHAQAHPHHGACLPSDYPPTCLHPWRGVCMLHALPEGVMHYCTPYRCLRDLARSSPSQA